MIDWTCPACGTLISAARREAHEQYWCDALDAGSEDEEPAAAGSDGPEPEPQEEVCSPSRTLPIAPAAAEGENIGPLPEELPPPTTEGWAHRRQEVQLEGPGLALVFEQQSLFGALSTAGAISPKRQSHSDTTLYISPAVVHTKFTGRCDNDFNVHA